MAYIMPTMQNTLLSDIEEFRARAGLSEHRTGIILANNGRLIERLRSAGRKDGRRRGRVWPETEAAIREALKVEAEKRFPGGPK